jgi:hypothetical protein
MPTALPSNLRQLLGVVDRAYDRRSWHGTNLRGSLRGLSPELAAWRPGAKRHNIWEIVVHAAYWKYVVRRQLTGEARGSFVLKGSNWFARPDYAALRRGSPEHARNRSVRRRPERTAVDEAAWRADVRLLEDMHRSLRAAIERVPVKVLYEAPSGGKVSRFSLIAGIAAHDLYHAGQIQLLKRLAKG